MITKKLLTAILFFIALNSSAQQNQFSIQGRWKRISEQWNDGAKDYTINLTNGEILTFRPRNIVIDSSGAKGIYELNGNHLLIEINGKKIYYLAYYDAREPDKLYFSPATPAFQCICDEGCMFTYVMLEEELQP